LALTVASPEAFETLRRRLRTRGASDGGVDDLGVFHSLWFDDPDGMRVELVVIVDPDRRGMHGPRPRLPATMLDEPCLVAAGDDAHP
jgi:hypothetical protein